MLNNQSLPDLHLYNKSEETGENPEKKYRMHREPTASFRAIAHGIFYRHWSSVFGMTGLVMDDEVLGFYCSI